MVKNDVSIHTLEILYEREELNIKKIKDCLDNLDEVSINYICRIWNPH